MNNKKDSPGQLKPGQRFNPYKVFEFAPMPNDLLRYPKLSFRAKVTWARLAQYAGQNGRCHPALETLANELGTSKPTVVRALAELIQEKFIERKSPSLLARRKNKKNRQGTTCYFFLWHEAFEVSNHGSELNHEAVNHGTELNHGFTVQNCNKSWFKTEPQKENFKTSISKDNNNNGGTEPEPEPQTGENGSCGCGVSLKGVFKDLSPEQVEYIELATEIADLEGKIQKGKAAYRNGVIRKVKDGGFDACELPELRDRLQSLKMEGEYSDSLPGSTDHQNVENYAKALREREQSEKEQNDRERDQFRARFQEFYSLPEEEQQRFKMAALSQNPKWKGFSESTIMHALVHWWIENCHRHEGRG